MLKKLIAALALAFAMTVPALATTTPFSNVSSLSFTTTQVPSSTYPITITITATNGDCGTINGPGSETADLFGPASTFVAGWGSTTQLLGGAFAGGTAAGAYTIKFNGSGCTASGTVSYT